MKLFSLPSLLLLGCPGPPDPPPECTLRLAKSRDVLRADGVDTLTLTATLGPGCTGTPTLTSTRGALSPTGDTTWTLQAGNVPGTAVVTLSLPGEDPITQEIPLLEGAPFAVQLHQHGPLSEGDTTHAYQTRQAERHGVDGIVWADHDYRYWHDFYTTPEWKLGDVLITEDPADSERSAWWTTSAGRDGTLVAALDDAEPLDDAPALHLTATGAETASAHAWSHVAWQTRGRRLYRPLIADVTVRFAIKPAADWSPSEHGVRVVLRLSQTEPGLFRSIVLAPEDDPELAETDGRRVAFPPLVPGEWNEVAIDVSAWADANLPDGRDATLVGFEVHAAAVAGARADVWIGGIEVKHEVCCDELVARQRALLDAELSGVVTHWVGQEISYETTDILHFLAIGDQLPWADYDRWSLLTEPHEIVADVQAQGGATVFAHPFGVTRGLTEPEDPEALVQATCDHLAETGVYGVDAIEVGYPSRVRPLADHLALWDCLLARGELATGVGTSDQHVTQSWATYDNPFVTWVIGFDGADGLLGGLQDGRAFFGDPSHFPSDVRFEVHVPDVATMGQVAAGLPGSPVRVGVRSVGLPVGDTVAVLVDGEVVLEGADPADASVEVVPGAWTVVRAEVRDPEGVVRMATNPLVLTTDPAPEVPERRMARP